VLSRAFRVKNEDGSRWKTDFVWLFALRDSAVHPELSTAPGVPHPIYSLTDHVAAAYSLEASERAVGILLDVLRSSLSPDLSKTDDVRCHRQCHCFLNG
jgi:hypothetical protein